jgi:hypothetical protein
MENNKAGIKPDKYFLHAYGDISFRHGGVGNTDAEKILLAEGYRPVSLPEQSSPLLSLQRWLVSRSIAQKTPANAILVCQFPVYPRMYRYLIRRLLKKGVTVIVFLADIDGLKDGNNRLLQQEKEFLRSCSFFIVHNENMEGWVRSFRKDAKIAQLGPFDFLTNPAFTNRGLDEGINFSGNLAKSLFLGNLDQLPELHFHVYGNGITPAIKNLPNITWHGAFDPHELPSIIKGSYGLIWDGNSIDGPEGSLGHYMQFINHHKLSLYILAGMPVIAPGFAGSASFIKEHRIGWLVQSLAEIPQLLKSISPAEYKETVARMEPIARAISTGAHLKAALDKLTKELL